MLNIQNKTIMTKQTVLVLIALLSIIIGSAQITKSQALEIDKTFDNWKDRSTPGMAAGIVKDGKIIYLKGFGCANMETNTPITPQTKFQLGALSKQFTSLAMLILEEQGKITRNDDIRKYLPELPEYVYKVKITHLLNHSSGLHDINRVNTVLNGATMIPTQEKALQLIAAQKTLSFEPGMDFSFHEAITESVLMAEIVARVSDRSFADFVKTYIFDPLGMQNSLIRDDREAILSNVAEPYQKEKGKDFKKREVLSSVVGAINAYSTAEDLAKWYLNFTKPNDNIGSLVQKLDTPVKLTNGKKFSYYCGDMAIGREFTHPERGLPIFWNFGLQGGYGSNVFRYIDQNIITFVLGNNNQYNGSSAMNAVEPFLKDTCLLPPVIDYTALKTKKMSASELKSFEGNYWFKKAGYASKLFVKNDTLHSQWLFTKRSQKLIPVSDNTFQAMGENEDIRLFKFKKEGKRNRLFFTFNDSEPDIMEAYTPIHLSKSSLQSYAGTYYNEAYAALFSFNIENGQLVASNLNHQPIAFQPVTKDVFTSTSSFFNSLEFLRDQSNEVKGFTMDTDGIHHLVFKKIASPKTMSF